MEDSIQRQLVPPSCPHPEKIAQLELAVTEAVANIIEHAYAGRSADPVRIEAEAFEDGISFRIHHHGESFDPSLAPPPPFDGSRDGGFGLHMINECVDEISYLQDEAGASYTRLVKWWS